MINPVFRFQPQLPCDALKSNWSDSPVNYKARPRSIPRRTKNLCVSSLIEAVRDQTRIVDLKQVNRVLIQPHWRRELDVA